MPCLSQYPQGHSAAPNVSAKGNLDALLSRLGDSGGTLEPPGCRMGSLGWDAGAPSPDALDGLIRCMAKTSVSSKRNCATSRTKCARVWYPPFGQEEDLSELRESEAAAAGMLKEEVLHRRRVERKLAAA
eukprot:456593-Prorocentrum_minimum.AAC.1